MNSLNIINKNNQLLVESREVADLIEKEHDQLLRSIRGYIKILDQSAKLQTADFFIETTYKNNNNQSYPCYLLTKKGCDMVANKMTGEKGIIFTATYVSKFEEMEQKLKNRKEEYYKNLSTEMKAILMHDLKIQDIQKDVYEVKEDIRYVKKITEKTTIDYEQQETIREHVNSRATEILGGKNSKAYEKLSKKVFSLLWKEYKKYFKVNSYKNTSIKKYEDALNYINLWKPGYNLTLEIDALNNQIYFK